MTRREIAFFKTGTREAPTTDRIGRQNTMRYEGIVDTIVQYRYAHARDLMTVCAGVATTWQFPHDLLSQF